MTERKKRSYFNFLLTVVSDLMDSRKMLKSGRFLNLDC